ncbi:hypothetical protein [Massilia psychrophila]|jgi:hypothetical protein|uniref:Alpha/beta hydrolase n=1 Tax=Massilia psychrophila TaxID=1603353 RepID=A0A2G8SVY2_9BURK|nr:hypothetical protein [Massilia psychrophila]PIL37892.1 hypothetical protein CR103_20945 [Massilia psychrophila]GGE88287.1 hypothetical protein GCM10008020_36600 [Massilia psychrophila]
MADVILITVHGMGETPPDYASDLGRRLRARIGTRFNAGVDVRAVYYQDILKKNEQEVWRRVQHGSTVRYEELRKFLLFGFGDAAGLENRKEDSGSAYELAQIEIAKTLLDAYAANGADTPLVLLSHSLGCHVLSSYIYDAQKARSGLPVAAGVWRDIDHWSRTLQGRALTESEKSFLACGSALGWITTGCNIPIFVAAHKAMTIIPISRPRPRFKWLNLYDPDDVLGWPLQPLSEGYRLLVEDRVVNVGQGVVNLVVKSWNPLSHSGYWEDDEVLAPLASMLTGLMR